MRVVHALGWYFPDSLGGTEIYVATVARELRRAGVDVLIAAPAAGATGTASYEHNGIPVFRYPIPAEPTRAEARGECVVRGAERFHDWLDRLRPDVVHVHTFVTGLDLPEIQHARACGARVFVTSHSSALGYVCLRGTLMRWGREACDGRIQLRRCAACALQQRGVPRPVAVAAAAAPLRLAHLADRVDHPLGTTLGLPSLIARRATRQRQLFDHIDGFFALTEAAREILVANGAPAGKVRVNRLGIDTTIIRHRGAASRRAAPPITIGYLGRYDPIKGLDDLLQAASSLGAEVPVRFDVRGVGDDAAAVRLRRQWQALAARDSRVSVGGPVARREVSDVLASWDVLCCPGRSLEGGPTVALEAFAAGTPVIGTRLGGPAELIRDGINGRLVPPGDWRALARVIRDVANDPSVVDRWRTALPAVRSMREVVEDYLAAYRSCIASEPSPRSASGALAATP
jgi:glycosyltransferase involved in cell wall biosynthesis